MQKQHIEPLLTLIPTTTYTIKNKISEHQLKTMVLIEHEDGNHSKRNKYNI